MIEIHAPSMSGKPPQRLAVFGHRHPYACDDDVRKAPDRDRRIIEDPSHQPLEAALPTQTFHLERLSTPTGAMLVVTDDEGRLRAADWEDYEDRMQLLLRRRYGDGAIALEASPNASAARRALEAYFDGDLAAPAATPVAANGTEFQSEVWAALRLIPVGTTTTYGALAAQLGRPTAMRAVGLANGANPISIFVPCHRVVGADASLTGYGGGLDRKRWLLAHESGATPRPQPIRQEMKR
jgi:methylated-DNA-[protein]-cysteine S-methyltransferase